MIDFSGTFWIILIVLALPCLLYVITLCSQKIVVSKVQSSPRDKVSMRAKDNSIYASFGRRLGSQITDSFLNMLIVPIIISMTLYYTQHRTLGDIVFWTRIYNDNKARPNPSWWQLTGRYLSKIITMFTFGIGILMILWTEKKQSLHDKIASTVVHKEGKINWLVFSIVFFVGLIVLLARIWMEMNYSRGF